MHGHSGNSRMIVYCAHARVHYLNLKLECKIFNYTPPRYILILGDDATRCDDTFYL